MMDLYCTKDEWVEEDGRCNSSRRGLRDEERRGEKESIGMKRSDDERWVRGFNICIDHVKVEYTVCTVYVYTVLTLL